MIFFWCYDIKPNFLIKISKILDYFNFTKSIVCFFHGAFKKLFLIIYDFIFCKIWNIITLSFDIYFQNCIFCQENFENYTISIDFVLIKIKTNNFIINFWFVINILNKLLKLQSFLNIFLNSIWTKGYYII